MNYCNIALTGAMGSGKSAAVKAFAELGAEVIDLDKICKELLQKDFQVRSSVRALLGDEAFDENGAPHYKNIAQKVFADSSLLEKYEQILHPAAFKSAGILTLESDSFCTTNSSKKIRIFEIPLLYEKKLDKYFKVCLSVLCSEELRLARLRDRGMSPQEISARDALQMSATQKANLADIVLFNEGSLPFLKKQANLFLSHI